MSSITLTREDINRSIDHTYSPRDGVRTEDVLKGKEEDITLVLRVEDIILTNSLAGIIRNDLGINDSVNYINELRKRSSRKVDSSVKTIEEVIDELSD